MRSDSRLWGLAILACGALGAATIWWQYTRPAHTTEPAPQVPTELASAPKEPNPWFRAQRAFPRGRIPHDAVRSERIRAADRMRSLPATAPTWELLGPSNIGGRITDVVVHPHDDDTIYVGAAEGGVLRSTDGGKSFQAVFDDQPVLSIGALALDPLVPDVVYVGTGEVNPGGGSVAYPGAGLFRSEDRGDTWRSLGLDASGTIGRIRIDPLDPDRIFVAAMGQTWERSPERGVFRSIDGGATWQHVLAIDDIIGAVDLLIRPDDPDVVFAATWERLRQPEAWHYGGLGSGVYRSDDGGDTWQRVEGGLPPASEEVGRIGLALCRSQPDVMYAIYADSEGYFDGIYRSADGGTTWTQTRDEALDNLYRTYGWWFGNVRVHPDEPDWVYALGVTFWRSVDGGDTWSNVGRPMHVDHHGMAFGGGADPVAYIGNDGGVYRSDDATASFEKLYDLPITQVYRIALDPSDPDAVYVGTQDNGTLRTRTGEVADWVRIRGGDGFAAIVHPHDSERLWTLTQYGKLRYSDDDAEHWIAAGVGIGGGDRRGWDAPLVLDPSDPDRRYFGTNRLYRSVDETHWEVVSPDLTYGPHQDQKAQLRGTLTTIAVSPADPAVLWTGSDDGRVQVTADGGAHWTDVSEGLPERWITSVTAHLVDPNAAFVTVSGFRWAESEAHVFRTDDLGETWRPIGPGLPDAPANDLLVVDAQGTHLIVATDVGVFETTDGGGTWRTAAAGLPRAAVNSVAIQRSTGRVYAGTYGRSVFAYTLPGPADPIGPEAPPPLESACGCSSGGRERGLWASLALLMVAWRRCPASCASPPC